MRRRLISIIEDEVRLLPRLANASKTQANRDCGGEIGTCNGGEGKAGPFSATTATEGEKELL